MTRILFVVAARWEKWGEASAAGGASAGVPYRNLAGDTAYGPAECGPYGPDPYGADPYGTDPYGTEPYGPAVEPYAPDPYGPSVYGPDPYGPEPYGPEPYGPEPYGATPYGDDPYSPAVFASPSMPRTRAAAASAQPHVALSSGLRNSVLFQVSMLNSMGIEAKMVEVPGPHQIDDQVRAYRPTHVIVEAIWVMPQKFDELRPLHPHVRWIVRNHSPTPFLAGEWSAFGFIGGYLRRGVEVMANDPRSVEDLKIYAHAIGISENLVTYGPNFYPAPGHDGVSVHLDHGKPILDVALFGAVRPLKNHLVQSLAAMHFADSIGKRLRLHVNAARVEMRADSYLNNVRNAFTGSKHELIGHGWAPHGAFRQLIRSMDFCLQSNQSESYNIVSADAAAESVPIIVSGEVPWIRAYAWADPARSHAISRKMAEIWAETPAQLLVRLHNQRRDMLAYSQRTEAHWRRRFSMWPEADMDLARSEGTH